MTNLTIVCRSPTLARGRLVFSETFDAALTISHFELLAIEVRHTEKVKTLPLHHGDPFDRMPVARSLVEDSALVTAHRRLSGLDA